MRTHSPLLSRDLEQLEQFAWDVVASIEHQYGPRSDIDRHLLAIAYLRGSRDKEAALRRAGYLKEARFT